MTIAMIVLSVLLVPGVIAHLLRCWHRDYNRAEGLADERDRYFYDLQAAQKELKALRRARARDAESYTQTIECVIRERDQLRYQLDQLLDPIVRLKMLQPGPPIYVTASPERVAELTRDLTPDDLSTLRPQIGPAPSGSVEAHHAEK